MTLTLRKLLTAALLVAASLPAIAAEPKPADASAAKTVEAFYAYHFRHDMGFSEKALKERQKWIDAGLYHLLLQEIKKPQSPDEVPDMDGDPFTCSQEYPNAVRVTKAAENGDTADVAVVFEWPKGANPPRPATITLKKDATGAWKIANIVLSDGYDLTKDLKQNLSKN